MMKIVLNAGVNINHASLQKCNALTFLSRNSSITFENIKLMFDYEVNVNFTENCGYNALSYSLMQNNLIHMVRLLINYNCYYIRHKLEYDNVIKNNGGLIRCYDIDNYSYECDNIEYINIVCVYCGNNSEFIIKCCNCKNICCNYCYKRNCKYCMS